MISKSLSRRLVTVAVIWITVALVVTGVALTALLRDAMERNFDDVLKDDVQELISLIAFDRQTKLIHLRRHPIDPRFNERYSGWYWRILADNGWREWSQSLLNHEFAAPAHDLLPEEWSIYTATGPANKPLRVAAYRYAVPQTDSSVLILAAGSTDKIGHSMEAFVKAIVLAMTILGLGLVGAVAMQVRYGLTPLRRMIQQLQNVRTGHASRMEDTNPPELAPLASEINALLDHSGEVIERARTQAGELAHNIKTSLAVLMNEAERIEGETGDILRHHTELMSQRVDTHLSRARAAGARGVLGARTEVTPVIESLSRTLKRIYSDPAVEIAVDVESGTVFQGERQDLEEVLGNLMDNACKWARSRVRVAGESVGGRVTLTVEDDGPGIPEAQFDEVLERGRKLDESAPGSGLGLGIVHDLIGLYAGSLTLTRSPLGGLGVILSLPAAR